MVKITGDHHGDWVFTVGVGWPGTLTTGSLHSAALSAGVFFTGEGLGMHRERKKATWASALKGCVSKPETELASQKPRSGDVQIHVWAGWVWGVSPVKLPQDSCLVVFCSNKTCQEQKNMGPFM